MSENENQSTGTGNDQDHEGVESCENNDSKTMGEEEASPEQVIEMMQELLKQSQAHAENLQKRNESLTKAFQELRAEYDMSNSRHKKALEDSSKYACTDFAKILINAMDSFGMAMDLTKSMPTVYLGLKMTYDTLEQEMKKYGIIKMYCELGSMPNPNLHQVIGEVPSEDYPEGSIVQIVQNGYVIHDRILRHASVNVAKGSLQ